MELERKNASVTNKGKGDEYDDLYQLDLTVRATKQDVPIRTQLGQLWKRASEMFVATTDLQNQLLSENYTADQSVSPLSAFSKYAKLLIEYEKQNQVLGAFDKMHREKNVTLYLDRIESEGEKIYPKGGSFEKEDFFLNMCRELANIIISNTRVTSEKIIIASASAADVKVARFPYVNTVMLRQLFRNFEPDFSKARDALFTLLKNWKNPMFVVNITSLLLSDDAMAPVRHKVEQGELFEKYHKAKKDYFQPINGIYVFKRAAPSLVGFPTPDDAWRYRDMIVKLRGDERKQGNLSSGYYRYDMTPAINRMIEEVADILYLCRTLKMKAVRLERTDYELARILVMNQITVYAPSMTNKMEPDPLHEKKTTGKGKNQKNSITTTYAPPGIYYEGTQIHFVYIAFATSVPSVTKESVVYPEGMILRKDRLMVVVEPIPKVYNPLYRYLPSSRVDKGLCLKTNITSFANVPIDVLSKRFSHAVRYRSWYIYTRIPFSSQDPYRGHFNYPILLPKVRKEVTKLDFTKAVEEEVADNAIIFTEEMMVESLVKMQFEAKATPKAAPLIDLNAVDDVLNSLKDMNSRMIHNVLKLIQSGNVAGTAYEVLIPLGQQEMITRVTTIYAEVASREQREARKAEIAPPPRVEATEEDMEAQVLLDNTVFGRDPNDVEYEDRDTELADVNEGFMAMLGSLANTFQDDAE